MNLKKLIVFAFAGALLYSCKKEEKSTTPSGYNNWSISHGVPVGLTQYYSYKPGTYWVFRDSVTGKRNTITVTANESGHLLYPHDDYSLIQISMHQSDSMYSSDWKLILRDEQCRLDYKRSSIASDTAQFYWAYPWAKTLNGFSVNGKTYDGVAEISDENVGVTGNKDIIYLNDSVGFIKMRILGYPTMVWELIEYNVVR